MFRHVLRNATRTLPLIFTLNASEAILTLAGLGFLGFGIEPTAAAEWGFDLNKSLADVTSGIWWTVDLPRARDRARRARHHAGRREPQRPGRPAAARPPRGRGRPPRRGRRAGRCRRRRLRPRRRQCPTSRGDDRAGTPDERDGTAHERRRRDQRPARSPSPRTPAPSRPWTASASPSAAARCSPSWGRAAAARPSPRKAILGLLPETATDRGAVLLDLQGRPRPPPTWSRCRAAQLRQVRGSDVAMVFQEPSTALNPVYTVGWQIIEGLRAHGRYTKRQARAKAIEILGRVGIPDPKTRVDYYPHQFSGGQKQRVVIAMALVLDPGLIVADEPTTALDVTVQAEILDLLRTLPRRVRRRDRADHPQHGRRRRPRRPGRGDVPGQDRRAGGCRHAVLGAEGPLHQAPAGRRAARRARAPCTPRSGPRRARRPGRIPCRWSTATDLTDRISRAARPRRVPGGGSGELRHPARRGARPGRAKAAPGRRPSAAPSPALPT